MKSGQFLIESFQKMLCISYDRGFKLGTFPMLVSKMYGIRYRFHLIYKCNLKAIMFIVRPPRHAYGKSLINLNMLL